MSEENNAPAAVAGEDTNAVLAHAALEGDKTFLRDPDYTAIEPEPVEGEGEDGEDAAAPEGEARPEKVKLTASQRVQQAVARQREAERDRDFYKEQALRGPAPEKPPAQAA